MAWIVGLGLTLVLLLAFNADFDGKSLFELKRNHRQKALAKFNEIYPGLLVLVRFLALIAGGALVILAYRQWDAIVAITIILIVAIVARLSYKFIGRAVTGHAAFWVKYFAWTRILSKLGTTNDGSSFGSCEELSHMADKADCLDQNQKLLIKGALKFNDRTIDQVMTPKKDIIYVKERDILGPMLLDDLHKTDHRVFPVAKGNLNRIIGTLYLDDVLPIRQDDLAVEKAMRKPLPLIEQGETLDLTLGRFLEYHCSQFVVVDEHQVVVGLISIHDVINALFGRDVTDE